VPDVEAADGGEAIGAFAAQHGSEAFAMGHGGRTTDCRWVIADFQLRSGRGKKWWGAGY
jgi:hypothetical protein